MRRIICLSTLLALVAAPLAPASAVGSLRGSVAADRAGGAGDRWLAAQAKAITATGGHYVTGMSPQAVAAAGLPTESYDGDELLPAGHLAGGKDIDVLDIEQTLSKMGTRYAEVTLRHGKTGAKIWQFSFQEPDSSLAQFSVGRIGSNGAPAVIVTDAEVYSSGSVTNYALVIDAFSGRTGQPVWGNAITGNFDSGTGTETNEPFLQGNFHGLKGPDTDVLFVLVSGNTSTSSYTAQPALISGQLGHQQNVGAAYPTQPLGVVAQPVGDLDGDGLADIVELLTTGSGSARAVTAAGKVLWTRQVPTGLDTSVVPLGRFTHSNYPDVAVDESGFGLGTYTVLNGRTGHKVFSVSTNWLYPLGRVGKHRTRALGELTYSGTVTTTVAEVTASWAALGPEGHRIYHHSVTAKVTVPPGDSGDASWNTLPTGDVQSDGAVEQPLTIHVSATGTAGSTQKTITGFINGRTGGFRSSPATQFTDGSLVSGGADDLFLASVHSGVPVLVTWKGSTRKKYYSRTISRVSAITQATVTGIRVTGNPCSDFGLVATNDTSGATLRLGVLSGRGQPLWMVSSGGVNRGAGTLHRYPTPKHFCVKA